MHDARVLAPPLAAMEAASAPSDDDLVRLAHGGVAAAREDLAHRYRQSVYLLALQLLGNRQDAFDVAQDSMLRFFAGLGQFTPGRPLKPWLLGIVRNQARDLWRRQRVRRAESIDDADGGAAAELMDGAPGPEEMTSRRQLRQRIWHAMSQLSTDHREIVVLRDFHDLSYAEIAQLLSIKPGTVMSRLHGARTQLRSLLAHEVGHA
jgi:RNA polymerase sigma-70 factor (ECF subfamily)